MDSMTLHDELLEYKRFLEHRSAPESAVRRTGAHRSAEVLSTTHISPFYEYYKDASYLKVSPGGYKEKRGGGIRGNIKGFSYGSRRRLMLKISQIKRSAQLPAFITLTYPNEFPDPKESKKHLDTFFKRFERAFPNAGLIWKLEPQERSAPHYHLLCWGVEILELMQFVPKAWFEIAGKGDKLHLLWHMGMLGNGNKPCVSMVKSWRGIWSYASKYLGKTFEVAGWGKLWTGRYWGIIAKENIPFGELVNIQIEYKMAVRTMRYQRRFSGIRSRGTRNMRYRSQTIFCDAEQWKARIFDNLPIPGQEAVNGR